MSYNKPKQKKDDKNKLHMSEICKGLNKFRKCFEGKWDQFEHGEITLRDVIRMGIMVETINNLGEKASQIDTNIEGISVEMSEEIPRDGVLINVKKEKTRFKITLKDTKGQIETHFIPLKAIKLEFNWLH